MDNYNTISADTCNVSIPMHSSFDRGHVRVVSLHSSATAGENGYSCAEGVVMGGKCLVFTPICWGDSFSPLVITRAIFSSVFLFTNLQKMSLAISVVKCGRSDILAETGH